MGPAYPCPPHWPQCVCVGPVADVVVACLVDELVLVFVGVAVEISVELDDIGADPVEPISPHLILPKVTDVLGSFASIVEGFPAELLQGPELPLSSQFMNWPLSFQMLNISTIPRPRASPIVVKPPRLAP